MRMTSWTSQVYTLLLIPNLHHHNHPLFLIFRFLDCRLSIRIRITTDCKFQKIHPICSSLSEWVEWDEMTTNRYMSCYLLYRYYYYRRTYKPLYNDSNNRQHQVSSVLFFLIINRVKLILGVIKSKSIPGIFVGLTTLESTDRPIVHDWLNNY